VKLQVLFLLGPTSSGKSAVAAALAQRLPLEIIAADSMQVYQGVPLLTAQPTASILDAIPHHLVSCQSLESSWSVAAFCEQASTAIADVIARDRLACVVGGTGLYIRALVDGLCRAPEAQPALRQALVDEMASHGPASLHGRLQQVDPEAAARIHPHDGRRIIRALEVHAVTDQSLSSLWKESTASCPWNYQMIGFLYARQVLYARINAAVELMFQRGVVDEVRALGNVQLSDTATQILGLATIRALLDGTVTVEAAIAMIQQYTRRYAKRQLTWFRRDVRIAWLTAQGRTPHALADEIMTQYVQPPHVT
jgi:tRNA dimethylallyltransferase